MLLEENQKGFKPFQYPFAFDYWQAQQRMHWLPEEVCLTQDIFDYNHLLTEDERGVLIDVLRFFTQADVDVGDCYIDNYLRLFKPIEVRMMLTAFSNMETIHMQAYSHLVDTLGLPESEYTEFLKVPIMVEKHKLSEKKFQDKIELLKGLACYGGFVEGLQLFGSFSLLMNFQRFGLLRGLGQIVTWSVRDESLHSEGIIKLYHTLRKEYPECDTNVTKANILIQARNLLGMEMDFMDYLFRDGRKIRGVTCEELKDYLHHIYHMRIEMIGLKDDRVPKGKSLKYMEEVLNNVEYTNFFINKSTEYTKANMTGDWSDGYE